jgi:hypothetical protein
VVPSEYGVFEPEKKFRAERGSGDGGGDDGPAERGGDGISEATTEREINAEGDEVGKRFEEKMRMDDVAPEVEIVGEPNREMGRRKDEEL